MTLAPTDYVASLRRDGAALAEAAETNLEAPVPPCPAWNVSDLVWHTDEVHYFWAEVAGRRLQDRADIVASVRPNRPGDDALVEHFRANLERLAGVLEAADPETEVWTWAPQKNVAFIQRRMAQETAVHRYDAQLAAGNPAPIDEAIAADGIDEFLGFFLPSRDEALAGKEQTIHLHATDRAGEWVVRSGGGRLEVRREHAKGDAALRGPASDLLLVLWRRMAPDAVEVLGDAAALESFLRRADLE